MTEVTLSRRIYPAAAAALILERNRQIQHLGWSKEHDRTVNAGGQLDVAGRCYIAHGTGQPYTVQSGVPVVWPWDAAHWKPTSKEDALIKGGSLLLAELDRLCAQNQHPVTTILEENVGLVLMELSDIIQAYVEENKDVGDKLMQALDKANGPATDELHIDNETTGVSIRFVADVDDEDEDEDEDETIDDLDAFIQGAQAGILHAGPTLAEDIKAALEEMFGVELVEEAPGVFVGKAKLSEITPMSGILGAERHSDYPRERTYANGGSGAPLFEFFRQFAIQYLDATQTTATSKGHEFMRHWHDGMGHWKDAVLRDGSYPLYHAVLAYFRHHEGRHDAVHLADRFSAAWLEKRNEHAGVN